MSRVIQPVVLCGGGGSRLYPISNPKTPKQFVSLGERGTLLEQTLERINKISNLCRDNNFIVYNPLLIMHNTHKEHLECLNSISLFDYDIIYEEYANDTAVAVANVCCHITKKYKDDDIIIVVFPADHYIYEIDHFINDICNGITSVTDNNIVLFGLEPTQPTTKYGYIIKSEDQIGNQTVKFIEKPNITLASSLISMNALWNSGIFAASNKLILKCLTESEYNIMDYVYNPKAGKMPSFDIVVLQQYDNIIVHECAGWKWSDVGTWDSFLEIPEIKQELVSNQSVITNECVNTQVLNRGNGNTVLIGCKNIIVIRNGDDILIMSNNEDYNTQLKNIALKISQ
jgi:mannose-1-phosphate guanylyltransferase